MSPKSNYDRHPCIPVSTSAADCRVGWRNIIERLKSSSAESRCTLAVECYSGTFEVIIKDALVEGWRPTGVIYTIKAFVRSGRCDLVSATSEVSKRSSGDLRYKGF